MAKINVLVVYGGKSVEHDISILSALIIMKALKESDKYQIIPLYLTKDNEMITFNDMYNVKSYEYKMENDIQVFKNKTFKTTLFKQNSIVYLKTFKKCSHRVKIDLIYPILHGFGVEDGTFKGWCDILGVTAVTSPIAAAALLQDKELTKLVLNCCNVISLSGYVSIVFHCVPCFTCFTCLTIILLLFIFYHPFYYILNLIYAIMVR